jgi:hypothetical protein
MIETKGKNMLNPKPANVRALIPAQAQIQIHTYLCATVVLSNQDFLLRLLLPEKCLSPEKTENQDSENQLKKILTQDSEIPEP